MTLNKFSSHKNFPLYMLAFAVSLYGSAEATAQVLEEVMVTAQKREQSAADVPVAISAFSGESLETLGLTDTRDLTALVPGFSVAKSSANTPIYTLRGVGFNTPNVSSTSPVGIYIDEAAFPYSYMSQGLTFDVKRVEVLKGPQGTLYGRNTTGGLVNYITNKPSDQFEARIRLQAGNFDTIGLEGTVSGPLTDSLSARLAIKTLQVQEGWQESVSRPGDKNGEQDRTGGRLILDFHPSDTFTGLLSVNYWEDKSDTQAGQAIGFNPEVFTPAVEAQALAIFGALFPDGTTGQEIAEAMYVVPGLRDSILENPSIEQADWVGRGQPPAPWPGTTFVNERPEIGIDSSMLSITARFDVDISPDYTLTSLTNYIDLERDDVSDRGGSPFELVTFRDIGAIESFSQEFRISGLAFDDRLNFIGGVYYSRDELDDRSPVWAAQTSILNRLRVLVPAGAASAGAPPSVVAEIAGGFRNWENFADITSETYAVFGQADYQLSDELTATFGARYTEDKADFAGCSRDYMGDENIFALWNAAFGTSLVGGDCVTFRSDFSGPVGPQGAQQELEEDNVSWRASLDWKPSDTTMIYGSISQGFKSGAFPQLSGNSEAQYQPAKQEEVLAYEIGTKFSPSGFMDINLAAYFYDYKDKQVFGTVLDPVFNTLTRLVNVPESEVWGIELDSTLMPTDQLALKFGASYVQTEITEYVGFDDDAVLTDFAGTEFAYTPEWQLNFVGVQSFDFSDSLQGTASVDVSYSSDQSATLGDNPFFEIDSYLLVGARVAIGPPNGRWELAAYGRNLTDEYYWNSVQRQTDTTFRYAGQPRTYGIEFTVYFD